jgi:hypothetical protein
MAIYIPPWMIAIRGGGETRNTETEVVPVKIEEETLPESPSDASPLSPTSTPSSPP